MPSLLARARSASRAVTGSCCNVSVDVTDPTGGGGVLVRLSGPFMRSRRLHIVLGQNFTSLRDPSLSQLNVGLGDRSPGGEIAHAPT